MVKIILSKTGNTSYVEPYYYRLPNALIYINTGQIIGYHKETVGDYLWVTLLHELGHHACKHVQADYKTDYSGFLCECQAWVWALSVCPSLPKAIVKRSLESYLPMCDPYWAKSSKYLKRILKLCQS